MGGGGIAHYAYNLCLHLARLGVDVTLLTGAPYELDHLARTFKLKSDLDAKRTYVSNLQTVIRTICGVRPHIIHTQATLSIRRDWACLLVVRVLGLRAIHTVHNVLPHTRSERDATGMRFAHRLFYHFADHLVVHADDTAQRLHRAFSVGRRSTTTIPHGDYTFFTPSIPVEKIGARRKLGIPEEGILILAFGTLRTYKGLFDLIPAFAKLRESGIPAHLLIAGKPVDVSEAECVAAIREAGVEKWAHLHAGYIDLERVADYFQAADIAVFPYSDIYQSGALQVAYAFSLPVVATRVGGFPESVKDGRNGILVTPGDQEDLARGLRVICEASEAHRIRMGRHSRTLANRDTQWADVAARTAALYRARRSSG